MFLHGIGGFNGEVYENMMLFHRNGGFSGEVEE